MLTFARAPGGQLVSITALAVLPKERRPSCVCFACERLLIPRLGAINQHHFAHRPESDCYAATGEGALHLSAKLRLQTLLQQLVLGSGSVSVLLPCPACQREKLVSLFQLLPGDEVLVEKQLEQYRPDLQLLREGRSFGVFEVVVTHPCPKEKWAKLESQKIPALEVEARAILGEDGLLPWGPPRPFPWVRAVALPSAPLCPACVRAEQRRARTTHKQSLPLRHVSRMWVIDQRGAEGERWEQRLVLSVVEEDNVPLSARLVSNQGKILREWSAAVAQSKHLLEKEVKAEISRWKKTLKKGTTCEIRLGFKLREKPQFASNALMNRHELHDAEKRALQQHVAHTSPSLWWQPQDKRWLRCYEPDALAQQISLVLPGTMERWIEEGHLRLVLVQRSRGEQLLRLIDADHATPFLRRRDQQKVSGANVRGRPLFELLRSSYWPSR